MPRYKYSGPDRELPGFGKLGHASVIEATKEQIAEFGDTFFKKVGDKEPVNLLPFGSVKFEDKRKDIEKKDGDQTGTDKAQQSRTRADEDKQSEQIEGKRLENEQHTRRNQKRVEASNPNRK